MGTALHCHVQLCQHVGLRLLGRAGEKAVGGQLGSSSQDCSDAERLIAFHNTDVCDYSGPLDPEVKLSHFDGELTFQHTNPTIFANF